MSLSSLLLILLAAALTIIQHITLKAAQNRTAFLWWMWFWAGLLFLPVLAFYWQPITVRAGAFLLLSSLLEVLYYTALAEAYRNGDLSLVFPLSRGTAPLFIVLWAMLFANERPTWGGLGGIGLIVAGLVFINLPQLSAGREWRKKLTHPAARWALLSGLCISLYTMTDKAGVRLLPPLLYTYLVLALTTVWLTPMTLRLVGWAGIRAEFKVSWIRSALAGSSALLAYSLILYVIRGGTPASYVGATREISIVFGAFVGLIFLREQGTAPRLAGALLIALGTALIGLAG